MAKGPRGERRPADVIGNAVHVMRIATGQIEGVSTDDGKNAAAVALGRMGGRRAPPACPRDFGLFGGVKRVVEKLLEHHERRQTQRGLCRLQIPADLT
jgi:hypothetical protein